MTAGSLPLSLPVRRKSTRSLMLRPPMSGLPGIRPVPSRMIVAISSREWRPLHRVRLAFGEQLAVDCRRRNLARLDGEERLAGPSIEDVDVAVLRDLRDRFDLAAVARHGDEVRRRGEVPVPDVVLERLE